MPNAQDKQTNNRHKSRYIAKFRELFVWQRRLWHPKELITLLLLLLLLLLIMILLLLLLLLTVMIIIMIRLLLLLLLLINIHIIIIMIIISLKLQRGCEVIMAVRDFNKGEKAYMIF